MEEEEEEEEAAAAAAAVALSRASTPAFSLELLPSTSEHRETVSRSARGRKPPRRAAAAAAAAAAGSRGLWGAAEARKAVSTSLDLKISVIGCEASLRFSASTKERSSEEAGGGVLSLLLLLLTSSPSVRGAAV